MVNQIHFEGYNKSARKTGRLSPIVPRQVGTSVISRSNFDSIIDVIQTNIKDKQKLTQLQSLRKHSAKRPVNMKLNTKSISDLGATMETHVTKKAIFMNGQKRSQNSIETINTKKHLQQKIIKRAQPLVLKRKSLNGIDTSYSNIEKMYLAAIEKIQKNLQKEVIAMK